MKTHNFNALSDECRKIWNEMESENKETYGTCDLLRALIKNEDSMINVILSDYNISKKEILEYIDNTITPSYEEDKYSKNLLAVYNFSEEVSKSNDEEIFEEYLIYSILKIENTTAYKVLKYYIPNINKLAEEYNQIFDLEHDEEFVQNLTKISRNIKDKFIGRKKELERIVDILKKKRKNTPLLIGSAGVGKSSIVLEIARVFDKSYPEYTIYSLDIASVISGTKYRGDLEEKLLKIIDKVKKPYTILFIDEIHNIIKNGEENQTLDIANILKPILSRGEISLIGATTLDEYYQTIALDKALMRRFTNVFIDEASIEETYEILEGIKKDYEKFYGVKYSKETLRYIVNKSKMILNKHFPDKAIDILDEVGMNAKKRKQKNVTYLNVDCVIFENLGLDYQNIINRLDLECGCLNVKKYIENYILNLMNKKEIAVLKTITSETTNIIIEDVSEILNIKEEAILSIDFERYSKLEEISDLFGANKGYVGYSEGGIISEHLIKYPVNVLIFKNLQKTKKEVQNRIEKIIIDGTYIDSKSRVISLKNTFIIIEEKEEKNNKIGFINNQDDIIVNKVNYLDEIILPLKYNYLDKVKELFQQFNYHNYLFRLKDDRKYISKQEYTEIKNKLTNYKLYIPGKEYLI